MSSTSDRMINAMMDKTLKFVLIKLPLYIIRSLFQLVVIIRSSRQNSSRLDRSAAAQDGVHPGGQPAGERAGTPPAPRPTSQTTQTPTPTPTQTPRLEPSGPMKDAGSVTDKIVAATSLISVAVIVIAGSFIAYRMSHFNLNKGVSQFAQNDAARGAPPEPSETMAVARSAPEANPDAPKFQRKERAALVPVAPGSSAPRPPSGTDAPKPAASAAEGVASQGAGDSFAGVGGAALSGVSFTLSQDGQTFTIRLYGVVAINEQGARESLTRLVDEKAVSCQKVSEKASSCKVEDGRDLASALVDAGVAQRSPAPVAVPVAIALSAATPGSAPAPSSTSESEERAASSKLYEGTANHFASGAYSKIWNNFDSNGVVIDEHGKRQPFDDLRPASQQFFSSIRNARLKTKIHNIALNGDRLVVHSETELYFDLHKQGLFENQWVSRVKNDVTLDTWRKKGGLWRLVESRVLSPEKLREAQGTPKRVPGEKSVVYLAVSACAKNCAASYAASYDGPGGKGAGRDYSACMAGCRPAKGAVAKQRPGAGAPPPVFGR